MSVNITLAKTIDGWMTEPELVWLAERAVEHRLIVEIGSHLGRSTRAMLDNTLGTLYAFDNWKGPMDTYFEKAERAQFYKQFCKNMLDHLATKKCIPVKGDFSEDLSPELKPDMVFIDGSHEYEDVCSDIDRWLPRIAPGGIISGHDFNWFSVHYAVSEKLQHVESIDDGTIWYKVL